MEKEFDADQLSITLKNLSNWKVMLFCLSCCERMYPNYVAFVCESGWGDAKALRNALDVAWFWLARGVTTVDLKKEEATCESLAPDTEDFDSDFVSAALDSASATASLMRMFCHFDNELSVEIASLSRDTVDMYVQISENMHPLDENREMRILKHDLMQNELCRQKKDLILLRNMVDELESNIQILSEMWREKERGSLNLDK